MQRPLSTELTIRVLIAGLALSVVMGAANVYFGLKAGMTVSASIPAAVIAMGLFRLFPRRGTILESNLVQTAASAGESIAAGVIFTMPALVLSGYWKDFGGWEPFLVITTVSLAGGILGVLFMIPMRKVFIVENTDLSYPEGVACARVLEAGESAGRDSLLVLLGIAVGAAIKVLTSYFKIVASAIEGAFAAGSRVFYGGCDVSPGLIAVGFIVRLPVAILIFLGGAIGWWIGIPLLGGFEAPPRGPASEHAWSLWKSEVRYMGVGAMVVGGLVTIFQVRGGLVAAIREMAQEFRRRHGPVDPPSPADRQRSIGGGAIVAISAICIAIIAGLYYYLTRGAAITSVTTVAMVILAFFFTAVASYIVGLVGNSNSPVSGMTITAVLATAALMWLFGFAGQEAILATLGVAGVVCCTACTSGDVCNDLKTGYMVGASPRRQQMLQMLGVAVAAFVMWPVLLLLHRANADTGGIGGTELTAPQATLFASLAQGFFGDGNLPRRMLFAGVWVGVALWALDGILKLLLGERRAVRLHIMPVAVGIYLPFQLSVPILLGGIVSFLVEKGVGGQRREAAVKGGILLASGLIAGEALTGVLLAFPRLFGLKEPVPAGGYSATLTHGLAIVTIAAICVIISLVARTAGRSSGSVGESTPSSHGR